MRGLQKEIDDDPATTPVLQRLKNRVERILKDMEDRTTTGLAAIGCHSSRQSPPS